MWKECEVCKNYEVSTYGEVRNKKTGKILKQKLDKSNCLMVNLSMGARGKAKYFIVARLVAMAFVSNPMGYTWVSHRKTVEELCEKIDCSPSSLWRFRTKPECFRKAPLDVIASCLRLANASNEQVRYILGL